MIQDFAKVYPDNVFSRGGPVPPVNIGQDLAVFLEEQVKDLYNARPSDESNLRRLLYSLNQLHDTRSQVIKKLEYLDG